MLIMIKIHPAIINLKFTAYILFPSQFQTKGYLNLVLKNLRINGNDILLVLVFIGILNRTIFNTIFMSLTNLSFY